MISPGRVHSVESDGGVERKRQTEEPEQESKRHLRASFQKPANRDCGKKCRNEHATEIMVSLRKVSESIAPTRFLSRWRDDQPQPAGQETEAAERCDRAKPAEIGERHH